MKYLVVLLMFGCVCRASITLFNTTSREVVREFEDYPIHLSPQFPSEGLRGQHRYLQVANECSSDLPPAPKDADNLWFGLLKYNSFCYPQQILNIQSAGYAAAILSSSEYDDEDDGGGSYYKASSRNEAKQSAASSNDILKKNISIKIPSTFVSNKTEVILIEYSGKPNITMVIYPRHNDFNRFLLILLGTLCLAIVVALVLFMVGYGCYRLYKIRKSIITKWKLEFLPSHTFRKGDTYEVCVICLDEYSEGARLRILSCGHAFHRKCVDPWLIKSGRECPLCKRKADLRRGRVKKCVGGDEDDDGSSADERTALLRDEARDLDEEDEDDDIDQVRIMPDRQTTINAIVHSSEDPPRSSGRRNYGSTGSKPPPTENLPRIAIRNGRGCAADSSAPPKPIEGDENRPGTSSVRQPIPDLRDEQSRATFYIGSVATDDGGLLDAGDRRPGAEILSGRPRPSDEESDEDYYDVRNEDPVV